MAITKQKQKTTKAKRAKKKVPKVPALSPEEMAEKFLSEANLKFDGEPLPKHFNWRTVKLQGLWDGWPGKYQCRDPIFRFVNYPKDVIFDPEGTGLKLTKMKKRTKMLEDIEVLWKVDRRQFLKGLTEEERATFRKELLGVEYFAISNRNKFLLATSFGPRGNDPVDDAKKVGPRLGYTPEELEGRDKPAPKTRVRKKAVTPKSTPKKKAAHKKPVANRKVVRKPRQRKKKLN